MEDKQTTLSQPVKLSGQGLHTGYEVEIIFNPAPVNHGYKFKRIDHKESPIVKADVSNVVDTSRGTTIEENGIRIHTIEHVMAALKGLMIDNVLIELNGPEAPIMDGSSRKFAEALKDAGIEEQDEDRIYYEIKEKILYYLSQNKVLRYKADQEKLPKIEEKIVKVAETIKKDREFNPNPNPLCPYCNYREICPAFKNEKD